MRNDHDRLFDILEAIERIYGHTAGGREGFEADELVQTWVVHHLQIIGEAASRLSDDATAAAPEVPWRAIVGMRNILVHGYFHIDLDAVWTVVEHDLRRGLRAAPLVSPPLFHRGTDDSRATTERSRLPRRAVPAAARG